MTALADSHAAERVRATSPVAERIETLIAPALEALGYAVVRITLSSGRRPTLQIMLDRLDGADVVVDDCVSASHTVSAILDVEDPISDAYHLEVSSPGIDRPLSRPADFARWSGFDAKVELAEPLEGRRRFSGVLLGLDDEGRALMRAEDGTEVALAIGGMTKARLVLTDKLIEASQAMRGIPDTDETAEGDATLPPADNDNDA